MSTWHDLPAAERRRPIAFGPRIALALATFGSVLLSFVAPLS